LLAATAWRHKVESALRFIASHDVNVVDMFRIDRYFSQKVRPIIVKLRTVWGMRLNLNSCYKFKDFGDRIFVVPDESPEARRIRVFDRLKSRAEREFKSVSVTNRVLVVDDVPVFSLKDGKISNNG